MITISPFAPKTFPVIPEIKGVRTGTIYSGGRYEGRDDLLLVEFPNSARVVGVLTSSNTPGAPVRWCQEHLRHGKARALVVNAGNANVFTGPAGDRTVQQIAMSTADLLNSEKEKIYLASTGVIGEELDPEPIVKSLPKVYNDMHTTSWESAAKAIMTTDTFAKGAYKTAIINGQRVKIAGIAKGSGMIAPNMATMLAFIFTDALLPTETLHDLLMESNETSFNSISVDGDTSTSDMCLLFAAQQTSKDNLVLDRSNACLQSFKEGLQEVMASLSRQIISDGEGISKLISVRINGAKSAKAARNIGMTVINSPLVKTAIAGEDPNWGRLVMAVGRSGEYIDVKNMEIRFGSHLVAFAGERSESFDERTVGEYMKNDKIDIVIHVGTGSGIATVWGCDLTHKYIDINADYRS